MFTKLICISDDIQHDFEMRFNKKAPKHDLLIMWERNAFTSGSVNFGDNFPLICNGTTGANSVDSGSSTSGARLRSESPPGHIDSPRSYSNSRSSSPKNNYTLRPTPGSSFNEPNMRRSRQAESHDNVPSFFPKNFNPALYKTGLCRQYVESGRCDYGEKCLFAHGKHELKSVSNYRTKVCTSWKYGDCQFGDNCMFLHPERNIRNGHRSTSMREKPYQRTK